VPRLLPAVAYAGRVRETGTGARTAPVAAALRAAASRSFQTTPSRPLVRPAVDVIAPSLVIRCEVKQLSPGTGETTLPCNFPELSGDLPVVFTVRILRGRWQSPLGRWRRRVSIRRCPTQAGRAGTHGVCDHFDEEWTLHDYLSDQMTRLLVWAKMLRTISSYLYESSREEDR